ncbi:MAG: response regulator [Methylococcales bacterium]
MGLAISRQLVERMGGWIGVESSPGKGAIFRFELRLAEIDEQPDQTPVVLSGKRVLIVDDNATNRRIVNSHLTHLGMTAVENQDGAQALSRLQKDPDFDLVILDYHMPCLDGVQLAEAMQADPRLALIPRVLLASGAQIAAERRRKIGILACLLKPIRREGLRRALIETLEIDPIPFAAPTRAAADPAWHGRKVLVAEDNPVNQKVIIRLLSKFGLSVELVANGAEALAILAGKRFDLVIMDCQMPVMDGYLATRTLRIREQAEHLPRTKVIALTAHAGEGEREKCLSAGMDDYLAKPVTKQTLIEMLARHFPTDAVENSDASHEDEPVCNLKAALETLDGDRELLEDMISLFLEDAPIRLEVLQRAQAIRDADSLAEAAHAFKGMVLHFHAAKCRELAADLEQAAKDKYPDTSGDRTRKLAAAVRELMTDLKERAAYV